MAPLGRGGGETTADGDAIQGGGFRFFGCRSCYQPLPSFSTYLPPPPPPLSSSSLDPPFPILQRALSPSLILSSLFVLPPPLSFFGAGARGGGSTHSPHLPHVGKTQGSVWQISILPGARGGNCDWRKSPTREKAYNGEQA